MCSNVRSFSAAPVRYSEQERKTVVPKLQSSGWEYRQEGNRDLIQKTFMFSSFTQAFSFMTEVAFHAEANAHHPEWFNVYNRVNVVLSTHDCSGFSSKDTELATILDSIYGRFQK
jgi:4a-hydroxytetrahydrobiopterin dehydratase